MRVAISIVLVSFFVASRASAADWYVDASAAAGGDGSKTKPFQTIAAALTPLQRGDTIWLASGTYDEVVSISKTPGTSGTTTIRAMPGATPVIDGTSGSAAAGFVIQTETPNTTFQDLTIQNAASGALGIQFYMADGGQVLNCTTKNMSSNAVTFYYANQGLVNGCTLQGNVAGRQTTGTVVTNNEVYGSSAEGIGMYDGSTQCTVSHNVIHDNFSVNLYLDSVSHSTYDGNLIYETDPGNDLEGIEISDEGHYADLPAPVNSYNTIINNVLYNNNLGIVFWYSGEWSTQALNDQSGLRYDVIANNTLVNNKGSFKFDASPAHVGTTIQNNIAYAAAGISAIYLLDAKGSNGIALDHNVWFSPDMPQPFLWVGAQSDHAGFVTASAQGAGDVLADPLFAATITAPPATNLAITKASPAVGATVSLASVTTDFLGAPRPATGNDIGAFQYGAVAPSDGGVGPSGGGGGISTNSDGGVSSPGSGDSSSPNASSSGCSCDEIGSNSSGSSAYAAFAIAGVALFGRRRRSRA
jgi:hypothetical protein